MNALRQEEYELLGAWMDGELDADQARAVAQRVAQEAVWQAAHEEMLAVNAALDRLPAPAAPDLTQRILARTMQERRAVRWSWPVGAAAAAACAAFALCLALSGGQGRVPQVNVGQPIANLQQQVDTIMRDVPAEDRFIVENLPLFRNYDQVSAYSSVSALADAATLAELAELEAQEGT